MTLDELVTLTRARLHGRARREVPPGPLIRAAVLVPIIDRGEPWLLFAKRTERVGHHKGQISFPGGVVRPDDPSLLAAALRECEEEIGLAPQAVEALGTLDDTETVATQFVITPFVEVIGSHPLWTGPTIPVLGTLDVTRELRGRLPPLLAVHDSYIHHR